MATIRLGLVKEVVSMAFDTVRTNKMRSGLTVLGIVIGITAIVGMTALIRGFDQSVRDLLRRPNLTATDARALENEATTLQYVDLEYGGGVGPTVQQRIFYRTLKTKMVVVLGTSEFFAEGTRIPFLAGRFFNGTELQYRKNVVVLAYGPYQRLFGESGIDPIGKTVRVGAERFEVVGAFDKRPTPGGFSGNTDDFVVIPNTTYARMFGVRVARIGNLGTISNIQISAVPREGVSAKDAMDEIQRIMRVRHGLRLDQPDDFDMFTQDSILKLYERVSQATLFALVVISSIALMVGGIGVMAIMMISVTERTREIGVRKALGARRREILWQFLIEAIFLTSAGGLLGIIFGSSIGLGVHGITGFPVSLPWWSFALGIGFSASVGIFFGLFPAFKASRLDPIEALRYE